MNKNINVVILLALLVGFGGGYIAADAIETSNTSDSHMSEHAHDENEEHMHQMLMVPAEQAPTVNLIVSEDAKSGWNIHLETTNFRFTPLNVNGDNVIGEGHAHLYIDGEKVARLYGPYFHYDGEFDGTKTFKVTLNANDHSEYAVGENVISASQEVVHQH